MTQPRLIDDCFMHDKDRLRHDDALSIIQQRLGPIVGSHSLALSRACGRISAETVTAPRNVPLHDNAAMDGYTYRAADFEAVKGRFPVSNRIAAGDRDPAPLTAGSAARIFTGAVMPPNADTVVMQEDCRPEEDGAIVTIPAGLKQGANRRLAGEDLAKGDELLSPGQNLRPQDIAALASIGRGRVEVFDNLKVAIISTGNEIRRPGEEIRPGEVYDANHYLLASLLQTTCSEITDCGIIRDEKQAVSAALRGAAASHDVILTTGGASRGEEDYVISTLDEIGKRHMWQMAIKPGRPMTFGHISGEKRDCLFFGLPGNPVAAMICFLLYVKPALTALSGGNWREPQRYSLPAHFEIAKKKTDRREFLRGRFSQDESGTFGIAKYGRDGSGIISSLREADGLIEIPEDVDHVARGDLVHFIPFTGFGI